MTTLLVVGCGVLGLVIGSFLNVVIYRVPRGQSIVAPRSACPSCHATIASRDNVPLVSWLVLRGRCRTCGEPISARYPLVECGTAVLFAAVAGRLGATAELPAYLVLVAGLLALALIDLDARLLPRSIVYVVLVLVAALLVAASAWTHDWRHLWIAAACGAAWFALFALIHLADARLLGFGDVRLAALLGFGLGWLGVAPVVVAFFAANVLGLAFALTLMAIRTWQWHAKLPYGTFLAAGAAVGLFAGPSIHVG